MSPIEEILLRSELPNLEQEPPIEWIRITKKEKVVAKSCLSKTTVALLKEYIFSFPTKNPYLFHSNTKNHISDETVNSRLRDLARDAGIELGNTRLRWHCFRKMIISQAKNLGVDPDIIKLMVGKSVKKDMLTYMSGIDVKTAFNILQEVLSVTSLTEESEEQVKSLKVELESLEQQLEATRTVLMGLFGLNRKRVEAMVVEQLEKESFVIRPDTGKLTIREFVKRMPDQYLFEVFEKMQKKAQKKKAKESSIFYTRQVSFIKRNNG